MTRKRPQKNLTDFRIPDENVSTMAPHEHFGSPEAEWDYLHPRVTFVSRNVVLEMCVQLAERVPGNIIEFGVAEGHSTRVLRRASRRSGKQMFACDSFKGLPEKFENAEKGTFACEPPRIPGVEIVAGYFEESLTEDLAKKVGRVALASLDADLYSSTICVLRWLTPLLSTGSILLFDEFLGEKESEKRAFEDWTSETGVDTVQVAEFRREPSGWGSKIDLRPVFQVVSKEVLPKASPPMRERLLASPPGRLIRRAHQLLRNRS